MARGGRREDDPTATARFARRCRGGFGRGGLSRAWGLSKSHPTREARLLGAPAGAPGRALALAEGAHEASPERARQRRWPRAVGCRGKSAAQPAAMTAALTLPGSAERGTRWRVQTKPGPRVGGGALPGTCPRDDSGKRPPGEEERE